MTTYQMERDVAAVVAKQRFDNGWPMEADWYLPEKSHLVWIKNAIATYVGGNQVYFYVLLICICLLAVPYL